MDSALVLVPNRLGWRKADDQVAHITLAMRPYYERRREKARQYASRRGVADSAALIVSCSFGFMLMLYSFFVTS